MFHLDTSVTHYDKPKSLPKLAETKKSPANAGLFIN